MCIVVKTRYMLKDKLCSFRGLTTVFDKVLARLKLPKENLIENRKCSSVTACKKDTFGVVWKWLKQREEAAGSRA
jgi:hypothetical protein